jgi:hypothetical protein
LLDLLPAAVEERAQWCDERSAARRTAVDPALRCAAAHSEGGDDVGPTNRRGLIGAGAATALGGLGVAAATPAVAREIDPELPDHWMRLLRLLGRQEAVSGPREAWPVVQRELNVISAHRRVARGELRVRIMHVESRWAELAAWLSEDTGRSLCRDAWTDQALWLAREANYPDMAARARDRQAQWATQSHDARRMRALADDALRTPGTSAQTRALCTLRAALGHALAKDAGACERSLAAAEALAGHADSPPPPWAGGRVRPTLVRAVEARCWLWMQPGKAIGLYECALREWPRDQMRDRGLHQARLALACAATGERDRAEAEGRKALAIARATQSSTAARELRRLGQTLGAG